MSTPRETGQHQFKTYSETYRRRRVAEHRRSEKKVPNTKIIAVIEFVLIAWIIGAVTFFGIAFVS